MEDLECVDYPMIFPMNSMGEWDGFGMFPRFFFWVCLRISGHEKDENDKPMSWLPGRS